MSDLDLLRTVADQLIPPSYDALRETARRRNRRAAALTGVMATAAVALLAGGALLVLDERDNAAPPVGPAVDGTRPLTYAEGADIHFGEKVVTAPNVVAELDVTDAGVVVRTDDGRIWFTDGTQIDQVGTLGAPDTPVEDMDTPIFVPRGDIVSGNTGSLAGWLEYPAPGETEVVVYDTLDEQEVARQSIDVPDGSVVLLHSVTATSAYWFVDPVLFDSQRVPDARMVLATGVQDRISAKEFYADTPGAGSARTLLEGHPEGQANPRYDVVPDGTWQLDVMGKNSNRRLEPQGAQPLDLRDGETDTPFIFDVPDAFTQRQAWLFQWLDDDTVMLSAEAGQDGSRQLLRCRVSTRSCIVISPVDDGAVLPEIGQSALR